MIRLSKVRAAVSHGAARMLPGPVTERVRRATLRRYDLPSVVARESRAKRWVSRNLLRLYYPPSMVSRENPITRWFATRALGKKPLLYHFDIHITDHCNLNCKGCGHFSNLSKKNDLDLGSFDSDMAAMAARLRVKQIYLLGGEPLLHPQVDKFVRVARRHFPDTRLYVVSNGVLVTRMGSQFWEALEETRTILLCDDYPIDLPVEEINALGVQHGVSVEWTDERGQFFKVPIDLDGRQDPDDSFLRCTGINNCPMYKDGRLYPCAFPAYVHAFQERFGLTGLDAAESDSISIRDFDGREIMKFMSRSIPWCRHCNFDAFEMFEWGRSQGRIEEWVNS